MPRDKIAASRKSWRTLERVLVIQGTSPSESHHLQIFSCHLRTIRTAKPRRYWNKELSGDKITSPWQTHLQHGLQRLIGMSSDLSYSLYQ